MIENLDLEDYRWLTSAAAADWLVRAADWSRDRAGAATATVGQVAELRCHLSPARTHLVLEQVALRRRAAVKFSAASRMFFTPLGLEQATDQYVAAYKAGRFPAGAPLADLCCGLGGDLLALAARGPAIGVDRDPVAATLAEANCTALAREAAQPAGAAHPAGQIVVADADDFDVRAGEAWHIDPNRRVEGRRSTRVDLHEPGPAVIDRARARQANGAVKLAPAATLPEAWADEAELEWISRDGECRQLVCWFGALGTDHGLRRATIVDQRTPLVRSLVGPGGNEVALAGGLADYLYEPDAAVLAADLTATLAAEHSLGAITPGVAYLTGDRPLADPALDGFRVGEVFPLDVRKLRTALRARNIGRLEIKKRGVPCEPEKLRRDLKLAGDLAATLIVLPLDGRPVAVLAERLAPETR